MKKKEHKINIIQLIQYIFFSLLLLANIFGGYSIFLLYTQITATQSTNTSPIASKLLTPLNQLVYSQILKDRQTRYQYSSSSPVPSFSVPEVFSTN